MLRWLRLAFTSTLTGLLLLGWFTLGKSQSTRQPPLTPAPAVAVEHELVHVDHPIEDAPVPVLDVAAQPRKFVPSRMSARRSPPPRVVPAARNGSVPAARTGGLAARARRIVFGDGRYRPSPFPGSGAR